MRPYYEESGITIYHGDCREVLPSLGEIADVVVTSPPYNLGDEFWQLGGGGRESREAGIGYDDALPEREYQNIQVEVLDKAAKASKSGASLFYNHKLRCKGGEASHPIEWCSRSLWTFRQEIIWDRHSTHNMGAAMFWPIDERILWMTKGKPTLPNRPIGMPTIWRVFGPVPNTSHPAPFREEIPAKCLAAIDRDGIVVLDPYSGSGTTLVAAKVLGRRAIGIEIEERYCEIAAKRLAQGVLFGASA